MIGTLILLMWMKSSGRLFSAEKCDMYEPEIRAEYALVDNYRHLVDDALRRARVAERWREEVRTRIL